MFYQVANALHEALGIRRPDTMEGAVLALDSIAPEIARLRALDAAVQEQLGASTPAELTAAIAQLRGAAIPAAQ